MVNNTNGEIYVTADTSEYWANKSKEYAEQSQQAKDNILNHKNEIIGEISSEGNTQKNALITEGTKQKRILETTSQTSVNNILNQKDAAINDLKKTSQSYVNEAKNWANKTNGTVDGVEYSAKFYSEQASSAANSVITQGKVSHFPDMHVSDNLTLLSKLKAMAHSSFDKSKFTVVGSSTISEDGIASGFSSDSYLEILNTGSKLKNAKNWSIEFPVIFKEGTIKTRQEIFGGTSSAAPHSFIIRLWTDGKIYFAANGITKNVNFNLASKDVVSENTIYKIKAEVKNGVFYAYINDVLEFSRTVNENIMFSDILRVAASGSFAYPFQGTINLKQFSIMVDGVEVFSGNKTGIDVIKPDDYTVVGSSVITSDGIANGLQANNYIQTNNSITLGNKAGIKFSYNITQKAHSGSSYLCTLLNSGIMVYIASSGYISIHQENIYGTTFSKYNTGIVDFELVLENNQAILYISQNNIALGSVKLSNITLSSTETIRLGADATGRYGAPLNGSIDLNSFKIYVDGNLVYQPCLKIPYTLSKTGSKIVQSIYRGRVLDMYNEYGYAPYYTLGDSDFTLATCKGSDIVAFYENGINKWEQRADLTLYQQGSCTANQAFTLLKPYRDENYALTVPYSNKTKTGFTPTVTGDFMANGKMVLN